MRDQTSDEALDNPWAGDAAVSAGCGARHSRDGRRGRGLPVRCRALQRAAARLPRASFLLLGSALLACSGGMHAGPRSGPDPATRTWRYSVDASPGARELSVRVELPRGVPEQLGVDRFAHPFLDALELGTLDGWRAVQRTGQRWLVPSCHERGCTLRYRYHLGDAAERIDRFAYAGYRSGALLAPPSTFLLAPQDYTGDDVYQLHVRTAPGEEFVTGVWNDAEGELGAPARLLFEAPYSGFGRFQRQRLELGTGTIELAIAPGDAPLGVSREGLRAAVLAAARAVAAYYGRFPVPAVTLIVLPRAGDQIAGMQLGNGGASIVLFLGAEVDDDELAGDWVLVHELLHLGFPTLSRRYLWLAEGLATYLEPLVRARSGRITEAEVWSGYVQGLPEGLPGAGDAGLDGTDRWGRTYWGGALVFLGLDLELRARTEGRLSLDTALRAILGAGGDTSVRWPLARTLASGDAALTDPGLGGRAPGERASADVGARRSPRDDENRGAASRDACASDNFLLGDASLAAAHARFADTPVSVDLLALYRRLGVRVDEGRVTLDDDAELAPLRRSLVQPSP